MEAPTRGGGSGTSSSSSTSGGAVKSGEQHSDAEWEKIRPLFVALYNGQGKPLSEVRKILGRDHGFYATLRQYKTRIIKWRAHKTLQPVQQESPPNGKVVPTRRSAAAREAAREGFVHDGPVPGLYTFQLKRYLDPPGQLGTIHVATQGISRFYSGVLHPGVDSFRVANQTNDWNIRQFYDVANAVSSLAAASQWQKVQPLYGEMLNHVVPILHDRNPIIVVCLLQVCCRFMQQRQGAVLQKFLTFLSSMAAAQKQKSHPLRLLSAAWAHSGRDAMELLSVCGQQAVDILSQELGPEHVQTLSARRGLHTAMEAKGDYASAVEAMSSVVDIETRLQPESFSIFDARLRIIRSQLGMLDLNGAEAGIREVEKLQPHFEQTCPNQALVHKLTLSLLIAKGQLLRYRMDPAAIGVLEEALTHAKLGVEVRDFVELFVVEGALAAAKKSFEQGKFVESAPMPC